MNTQSAASGSASPTLVALPESGPDSEIHYSFSSEYSSSFEGWIHNDTDPSTELSERVEHLIQNGSQQAQIDAVFAVRFATANAREMAHYLLLVYGFVEIAYKGLETGATCFLSHVLRYNEIVLEILSPLEHWGPVLPAEHDDIRDLASLLHSELQSKSQTNSTGYKSKNQTAPLDLPEISLESVIGFGSVRKALHLWKARNITTDQLLGKMHEAAEAKRLLDFVARHGCGVCDIVYSTSDVLGLHKAAIKAGAIGVRDPHTDQDTNGAVLLATVNPPHTDLLHTLVFAQGYKGAYLPGYVSVDHPCSIQPSLNLFRIDHCVLSFSWNELAKNAAFYANAFGLRRYWGVDEKDVGTANTGLNSVVMANANASVKIPINEPAKVKLRGQVEEFYDFYGGPGVQHVAFLTHDILADVEKLRRKGVRFNSLSALYYDDLERRLHAAGVHILENFDAIRQNHILVDFDPEAKYVAHGVTTCTYLLQIFCQPYHDRPTFFFEFIQRNGHDGFGKGSFKGLFESIESQQRLRGTLV